MGKGTVVLTLAIYGVKGWDQASSTRPQEGGPECPCNWHGRWGVGTGR